jgi:AraC-like DNA-binding protein
MARKADIPQSPDEPSFFSTAVAKARRFYFDLNPDPTGPVRIVSCGVEHCTADYVIERKGFPFYCIEYVARGKGSLHLKGQQLELRPGLLFTYGPKTHHHIAADPANPPVKYFVNFAGAGHKDVFESCAVPLGRASQVHPPNALQALFDELIEAGLSARRGKSELCHKLLECLILKVASARAPLEGTETLAFTTYQQCRDYIEAHFRTLKTLEEIAANCHVNSAYLCRLFRRYDHQSPYQLLLRLKMQLAAERLQQSNALVKQVAEELSFADAFHFSRVFKAVFGVAPNEFRKLQ